MIWPFKKRAQAQTMRDFASQRPPPCGKEEVHWDWTIQGFRCPACAAIQAANEKLRHEDRMAEKIAAAVAAAIQKIR